jgi:CRP/FNR family cyclic AMP-dependent transcriptional regulator
MSVMIIPQLVLMGIEKKEFPAGHVLVEEGTAGGGFYVLDDGEVAITKDGKELARIGESGQIFGEMSALMGRSRRATVTTTRPSTFFMIDDLLTFLRRNPEMALLLLRIMAERVEAVNAQLAAKKHWWLW